MKTFFTICFAVLFTFALKAQGQQTLIKTLAIEGQQVINVEGLQASVEARTWEQDKVRLQLEIKSDNFDETLIKRLIMAGRYHVEAQVKGDSVFLAMPNFAKAIMVKGTQLEDHVKITVFLPKGFSLVQGQKEMSSL